MKYVLDTCILIDDEPIRLPDGAQWAISVASISELHFGVLVARSDVQRAARLRRLSRIERTLDALPVTAEVARIHAAMAAHLKYLGGQPRPRAMDLLVAATAAHERATLLTHNLKDFKGLDEFVSVVPPTRPAPDERSGQLLDVLDVTEWADREDVADES